jgi:hypothetical protein
MSSYESNVPDRVEFFRLPHIMTEIEQTSKIGVSKALEAVGNVK